jgi:hypothetical protein
MIATISQRMSSPTSIPDMFPSLNPKGVIARRSP